MSAFKLLPQQKLLKIIEKYHEINTSLMNSDNMSSQDICKLSKEKSDLQDIAELASMRLEMDKRLDSTIQMLSDPALDEEINKMAEDEKRELEHKILEIDNRIKVLLLPKDEDDNRGAILEVRAGTGGEEAALFAGVLFTMYRKYSENRGWKFEILSINYTGLDGIKEASACISGKGVFARLKFESGVHRVQRVPETESSGRIHTSTATIAILPEVEDVDIQIDEKDLRIDVYRASGAGGQHINKTESAVRITHIPTGTVAAVQDEKSQHKNKAKAMKILLSRIYEAEREKKMSERSAVRKTQVSTGDRSQKARTYNYHQNRITDHRINLTIYSLDNMVEEAKLDPLINALIEADTAERLASDNDEFSS